VADRSEIERRVYAILGDFADDPDAIPHGDRLRDLGIDSLDLTEIVARIDAEFGIALSAGEMSRTRTIADLVAVVASALDR
jgi:acyl carrier protein